MSSLDLIAHRGRAQIDALGDCPPWWRPFKRRAWRRAVMAIYRATVRAAGDELSRSILARLAEMQGATWQDSTAGKGLVN